MTVESHQRHLSISEAYSKGFFLSAGPSGVYVSPVSAGADLTWGPRPTTQPRGPAERSQEPSAVLSWLKINRSLIPSNSSPGGHTTTSELTGAGRYNSTTYPEEERSRYV